MINNLLILFFAVVMCAAEAVQIESIYPNMNFGYGQVHAYYLANGDIAEVRSEFCSDNWVVGDDVERATVKKSVWKHAIMGYGSWQEVDEPVLVNKYEDGASIPLLRYTVSPTKSWQQGKILEIGPSWIRTNTRGRMAVHSGINLQEWKYGDKVRFQERDSTSGTSFMVYNESTKKFYYPFWSVADNPWAAACYRVIAREHIDEYTYYTFDLGLKLKVPKRKRLGVIPIPLFNVGDFAMIKLKESSTTKGYGLLLVNPNSGEEVLARSTGGVPGYNGKNCDSLSVTMYNCPYRLEFEYPSQCDWDSALIALNATHNGYVLLRGYDFWQNGLLYQPFEHDSYSFIPLKEPVLNLNPGPQAYEGIFPYEPR